MAGAVGDQRSRITLSFRRWRVEEPLTYPFCVTRTSRWPSRLVILSAILLVAGWGLVLLSGHGGDSTGGSEAVWEVGGLMVYAGFPLFLIGCVWAVVGSLASRRSISRHS